MRISDFDYELPEGAKVRGRLTFYFVVMDSAEKKSDLSSQTKVLELDARRFGHALSGWNSGRMVVQRDGWHVDTSATPPPRCS